MSTKFFTNEPDNSVFNKFKGIIEAMKDLYAFHAVVGYFRSSGYFALQPYLQNLKEIKILVGINVDEMFAETQKRGLLFFGDDKRTKEKFLEWFVQDVKESKYSKQVESGILQFIEDLIAGKIEVRASSNKTIHAKFYLFLPEKHSEHSDGWVIMGSSNLTDAGLGIKQSPNYELNIALKNYDDVQYTKDEFAKLWADSTPILPADIKEFKKKTHIGQDFPPFEIYVKFLAEYFGKNIDYDPDTVGDLPKNYKKFSYQVDAVNEGFQMLLDHNGFFLADVVGLGKTVVAAMIAKRFLIANGSLNTKILIIYPPALEKNWKNTFREFGIAKHTKFITNGRLEKILDGKDLDYWAKEEYDLILVDEAHRYRNHTSQMFQQLQRICKAPRTSGGVKGEKKKVVLISATPLNNRPEDIAHQLQLFQDYRRSSLPVTNLQNFFGPKIREYKETMREDNPNLQKIRDIYGEIREKIISPITIRRTRNDLKKYPKYLDDLKDQGIVFPEIAAPKAKEYLLNAKLSKLFYHTIFYLTDEDKIQYHRYKAVGALKKTYQEEFGYEKAYLVSKSLAGIMKTLMVKRLESSFTAFKISLGNLLKSTRRMIEMFKQGKVFIAPDLDINSLMEKGMSIEEIENYILQISIEKPNNRIFPPEYFEGDFIEGLKKDEHLLNELLTEWQQVTEDPKLEAFFTALHDECLDESINPTGKLVVFTESKDTANYLAQEIESRLNTKVLKISAENRRKLQDTIQENFDANFLGEQKNDFNILITTDVLAEGVNLHRSNVIVNYDTPWNATRLMQRIGRVNRIGSVAGTIRNYNFYPSQQGDEEIKLYKNALIKLQGFHTAFGEDAQIFTHEELVEQFELFKEGANTDEDKRLIYLRFIREYKENNPREFKRIKNFPLKARTARSVQNAAKKDLLPSTVVFLKSSYKSEFYRTDDQNRVIPLTFLEAAEIFEATANEQGLPIPETHYAHIQNALQAFEQDFFGSAAETATSKDKADGNTKLAQKFLRETKGMSKSAETKKICDALIDFIEKGTYAAIPNELKKIRTRLGKTITFAEAENLIIRLAKKYDAIEKDDDETESTANKIEANIEPNVVLSETFL